MKNIIKTFGIAAMVAIIGLSMAALSLTGCDPITSDSTSNNNSNNNNNSNGTSKWTAVPNTTFNDDAILGITYGGDKFVAWGAGGKIAYSSNGIDWTAGNWGTYTPCDTYSITYGGDKFVGIGGDGVVYSSDGITWARKSLAYPDKPTRPCIYGNGKFVNGYKYSSDGLTWTGATTPIEYISPGNIAYGGGKFVIVSYYNDGKIAYSSDDGNTWTIIEPEIFNDLPVWAIAYGNGKFVAGIVGDPGKIAYSSDGINWTWATTSITLGVGSDCIAYGNGKFVAYCYGKMAYSSDGINWTVETDDPLGKGYYNRIYDIAYGNGKFVAVGQEGKMAYLSN